MTSPTVAGGGPNRAAPAAELLDVMCGALGLPDWPGPDPAAILVACSLDLAPVVKGRPRVYRTPGGKVRTITPPKTAAYETALAWMVKPHLHGRRVNTADELGVMAVFHLPNRRRCDIDNLLKALLDACTGVVWGDDSQVGPVFTRPVRGSRLPRVDLCVYLADSPPQPMGGAV